jgi:SnoaL-like domain
LIAYLGYTHSCNPGRSLDRPREELLREVTMDELTLLKTRAALVDNFNNYACGVDSKDWQRVRNCFADRVSLDYASVGHVTPGDGQTISSDEWIEVLQGVINGFDLTRHSITNHRFHIEDDILRCQAYFCADHIIFADSESRQVGAEDCVTVVGEYCNQYQYREAQWKICHSQLLMNYTTGNVGLFERAQERLSQGLEN